MFGTPISANDVRTVSPPSACSLASWYDGADLVDAFAVTLPGNGPHNLSRLAERALGEPAPWVTAAMALRDIAVRPFGVGTSRDMRRRLEREGRDRIDFFPVISRTGREIVIGADDRHLDFRLSLLLLARPDGREDLVATTVVHCRNRFGRAYLATILPGHVLVVCSMLRRAVERG
jgi:hypothetical protein